MRAMPSSPRSVMMSVVRTRARVPGAARGDANARRTEPKDHVGRLEDLRLVSLFAAHVACTVDDGSLHDSRPPVVLVVGDLLEPIDSLSVERLLDGDVRHRRRRRCAVPVLLVRIHHDHVARTDLFDRTAPALVQPEAEGDDERLAERMRVPVASRARFEGNVRTICASRRVLLKQRIKADGPREMLGRRSLRGLRAASFDLHV